MNLAIIVAAGQGKRMQNKNKIFLKLVDKEIISHTLEIFEKNDLIHKVIIVGKKEDEEKLNQIIKKNNFKKVYGFVKGGEKRQDSVFNGLQKAKEILSEDDFVVIHNGTNALVTQQEINECIKEAQNHNAAVIALPTKDTIKMADEKKFVTKTLNRKELWSMQTPQVIQFRLALEAFENAYKDNFYATDDVALVENLGKKVKIVHGSYENIKITTASDLLIAEQILKARK